MDSKEKQGSEKNQTIPTKRCFVITPIGEYNSPTYRSAMGVIDSVIRPVFLEKGYDVKAAHEIPDPGSINRQIITRILEDEFAVANLTGPNPNVMYELAVRHATKKPLICLAEYGTHLPFDIKDERTIFYHNDMQGVQEIIPALISMIDAIENNWQADNPITRGSTTFEIQGTTIKATEYEALLSRLDDIQKVVSRSSFSSKPSYPGPFDNVMTIRTVHDNGSKLFRAVEELNLGDSIVKTRTALDGVYVDISPPLSKEQVRSLFKTFNGDPLSVAGPSGYSF